MLKETFERFMAESPAYFKKLQALGVSLMSTGAALLAAPENVKLPQFLINAAGYMITAGFVMTLVAKLTKKI